MSLVKFAHQLGVGDRQDIVSAAKDYQRRIQSFPAAVKSSLSLSASAEAVISVDIACQQLGHSSGLDTKTSAKLAGLKHKLYGNCVKNVIAKLGLEKTTATVEEVAVKAGCSQVRSQALKMLELYKVSFKKSLNEARRKDVDLETALFRCAAVGAAAKEAKTKPDKTVLTEMSGESRSKLDETVAKILEAFETDKKQKAASAGNKTPLANRAKSLLEKIRDDEAEISVSPSKIAKDTQDDGGYKFDPVEYNRWKESILRRAKEIK